MEKEKKMNKEEIKGSLKRFLIEGFSVIEGEAVCNIANLKIPLKDGKGTVKVTGKGEIAGGVVSKDTVLMRPLSGSLKKVVDQIHADIEQTMKYVCFENLYLVYPLLQIRTPLPKDFLEGIE